jgi:hypothetical protein
MESLLQYLLPVMAGVILLWFGYTLFFGSFGPFRSLGKKGKKPRRSGKPGDSHVCPVCSTVLSSGQLVSSHAFPSLNGGKDRIMHIRGCYYCLEENVPRYCPVCGRSLQTNEFLVARMFKRTFFRHHVHVLGCSRCRKVGQLSGA